MRAESSVKGRATGQAKANVSGLLLVSSRPAILSLQVLAI